MRHPYEVCEHAAVYALALATQLGGAADGLAVALGWACVASRVVHSLVQARRR